MVAMMNPAVHGPRYQVRPRILSRDSPSVLLVAVTAVAELVGQRWMCRMPAEFRPGPGPVGALIEQQHLGEVVAQAGPGLIVGTGVRSGGTDGGRGCLRQLGHGGVHPVADDVAAASRLIFQDAPEEIR